MIPTLQSLRFLFILLIFLSHFAYGGIPALDAGGDCGVAFFFVLSGFVTSLGYADALRRGTYSHARFLKRRLLKLYPLHLLCLAVCVLMLRPPFSLRLVLNALLLQSWVPLSDYYFSGNAVSWFLSDLMFCYLLFPLLFRRLSAGLVGGLLVAYSAFSWWVPAGLTDALLYVHPLARVVDFVLGMALFRLYERPFTLPRPTAAEALLALLLLAALAVYPWLPPKLRVAPFYWLLILPTIWVYARGRGRLSRWLSAPALVQLASVSMPFYLTHKMLIDSLVRRLPSMPYVAALFVTLFCALMVAWILSMLMKRKNL